MGLTWNDINELIQQNPILQFAADQIKSLGIEWLLSLYQKGKSRTVDEELVLCLESALESFSKQFALEYDDTMALSLLDELKARENLNQNDWRNILEAVTGLQFDEKAVESWRDIMDRMISEKRLVVLRDYIALQRGRKHTHRNSAYPRILTSKPALPPEEYIDRSEYDKILQKVQEVKKLVLVNGLGGIGKSTVCRKIFHTLDEQKDRTLAWVTYHDKNLLEDLRKQLFYPKEGKNWPQRFIQFLQQDIEDTAVIFVDNINAAEEEEPFLQELANANCSVICTSRITEFRHYETVQIDFFSMDDCVRLFNKYYCGEFDYEKISRIVKKAGRHTLVIEILAKIAKAEGYTLSELEEQLQKKGLDLEGIASVEMREDTLIGHLSRTFNTEKLNAHQKRILYCMSILPIERIPYRFKEWLGLPNRYNLNYLEKHAWFVSDKQGYYMHPVIKEVVKRTVEPQKDAAVLLLKNLTAEIPYKENPDFEYSMQIISFIEAVLPNIEVVQPEVLAQAFYNISLLYGQFNYNEKALFYIEKCINLLNPLDDQKELLGCAYNHQGFLYYFEYKDQHAEASYRKAYQIRKKLKSKKLLAQTESNLALLYQGMWKEEKDEQRKRRYLIAAEKYQKEALKVFESIFHGEEQSNLASAYNNMAAIKNSLCENEEAVFYYNKAASIRSHMKGISPGNLSVTYYGLSNTYYDMAESKKEGICYLHYLKMSLYYLKKAKDLRISEIRNGNQKWSIDNLETKEQILLNKIKDCNDFRKEMTNR